ncbi:hypothetical protein O181_011119 [Austropuccinia psidii MF-1]|uniref:Uncharacterized protein n=1 Tax=Austropuccinia psidii MF-1 TaxID=1389203 RepID=A0A9Q3BSB2_9BASI|nr:hypothetical protein [Austropuccinia psidii MF-1]
MSSKLTELTGSSPSALPPYGLCGSGILSQLAFPWSMASSGHFDPGQTYDAYKEVEVLDPACTECLVKGKDFFQNSNLKSSKFHFCFVGKKPSCCPGPAASNVKRYLWSKKDGHFGKEFPVSEGSRYFRIFKLQRDVERWTNVGGPIPIGGRPIYSSSAVPISKINTEGVVKRIRQISDSPPDPDAEGSDELDGEEVEVVDSTIGHQSSASPSQPPTKRFQSRLIPSTPRNFQPTLATITISLPPESPSLSHTRPAMIPAVRPSPIKQSRASPIVTPQQIQAVASSSRRREELSPLPFPDTQLFQKRDCWPIQVTREEPNTGSENQDAVARLFRKVDRNSREVIMYANNRTIPGTASEEMAEKFAWYEDELINDLQRNFDHMGRGN